LVKPAALGVTLESASKGEAGAGAGESVGVGVETMPSSLAARFASAETEARSNRPTDRRLLEPSNHHSRSSLSIILPDRSIGPKESALLLQCEPLCYGPLRHSRRQLTNSCPRPTLQPLPRGCSRRHCQRRRRIMADRSHKMSRAFALAALFALLVVLALVGPSSLGTPSLAAVERLLALPSAALLRVGSRLSTSKPWASTLGHHRHRSISPIDLVDPLVVRVALLNGRSRSRR
jgi:hypothetical protein